MKGRLIYVELKSGYAGNGPAWIDIAGASKSGNTVYSNGKAFRSLKGSGVNGNYYDIDTHEEYWISGIKKNNQDRHWTGGGKILISHDAIDAYLARTGARQLPQNIVPTTLAPAEQSSRHQEIEHVKLYEDAETREPPRSRAEMIKAKTRPDG